MVGRQWGLGGSGLKAALVAPKLGPKCAYKSALWQLGSRFRLEVVATDQCDNCRGSGRTVFGTCVKCHGSGRGASSVMTMVGERTLQ